MPGSLRGEDICSGQLQPALMGDAVAESVQCPNVPAASPQRYYDGAVLRPADRVAFPGARPVVVLQPGLSQNKCTLWWAAQYLAGHGFVTVVHDTPDPGFPEDPDFYEVVEWANVAIDEDAAVAEYLALDATAYADVGRLGFAGYEEGAVFASTIDTPILADQQTDLGIDAIVRFNNLRYRLTGDLSGNGL
mgnify:CR=1 FL=1